MAEAPGESQPAEALPIDMEGAPEEQPAV